jgi:hypothetical protein
MNFIATLNVNEHLNNNLIKAAQELVTRAVKACGEQYSFDSEEAIRMLGLEGLKMESKSKVKSVTKKEKKIKIETYKVKYPIPYNGLINENLCYGIRQNQGLYTQCQIARKGEVKYCKVCLEQASQNENGKPDYGTIQDRQAVGIFEYIDPKGNKPVAFAKIMKKYKLTEEQVREDAIKLNIKIDEDHFKVPEEKPKKEKVEKAEKASKGRPKKSKKVLEVTQGEEDDLFASLVANANVEVDESSKKLQEEVAKKEKETLKKAEKEAKKAVEKAEKEAKLALEKAEKEAKKAAEKAEKEAKKAAEKAEKEAKKAVKMPKKSNPKKVEETENKEEVEKEPDVVKKIEFEGKKYLKSKKSGLIYDYNEYVKNQKEVMVGKWSEVENKIIFNKEESEDEEEEEEEYDM